MPTYLDTTGSMRLDCSMCTGCAGCILCAVCGACMFCIAFPPVVAVSVSSMVRPFYLASALGTHAFPHVDPGGDGAA